MDTCIGLARADTHTGALDWYRLPITELSAWVDKVNALEKTRRKK